MTRSRILQAACTLFGTALILYYAVCGILHSFATSGLWIYLVTGAAIIAAVIWYRTIDPRLTSSRYSAAYKIVRTAVLIVVSLLVLAFLLFECLLIAEWYRGSKWESALDDDPPDVIVVLGAGVEYDTPGATLRARIDTAYKVCVKFSGVPVIACGGVGDGDIISEAECIKRELVRMGVPENTIFTEDVSTSTWENFLGAASLLPDGTGNIAVVTSGFHLYRAKITATSAFAASDCTGFRITSVAAPCINLLLPNYAVREFAGLSHDFLYGKLTLG